MRSPNLKKLQKSKTPARPIESQLLELYPILFRSLPTLKYNGWRNAVALSKRFPHVDKNPTTVDSIADVLNAEWLWRLNQIHENENDVHQADLEASRLCYEIMARLNVQK